MSDNPSRDEVRSLINEKLTDKLEAVEARIDGRFTKLETRLELLLDRQNQAIELSRDAKRAANEAAASAAQTKWNIAFAAVGVAAVIVALWSVWSQALEMAKTILSH